MTREYCVVAVAIASIMSCSTGPSLEGGCQVPEDCPDGEVCTTRGACVAPGDYGCSSDTDCAIRTNSDDLAGLCDRGICIFRSNQPPPDAGQRDTSTDVAAEPDGPEVIYEECSELRDCDQACGGALTCELDCLEHASTLAREEFESLDACLRATGCQSTCGGVRCLAECRDQLVACLGDLREPDCNMTWQCMLAEGTECHTDCALPVADDSVTAAAVALVECTAEECIEGLTTECLVACDDVYEPCLGRPAGPYCLSQADCTGETVCNAIQNRGYGICRRVFCQLDIDCAPGEVCLPVIEEGTACVSICDPSTAHCPLGLVCHETEDGSGHCGAPCDDESCPEPQVCDADSRGCRPP